MNNGQVEKLSCGEGDRLLMKRISMLICCVAVLALGATMAAADQSSSVEEAFVDALGSCGGSSKVSSLLATTKDPGLMRALRYAIIVEGADDAAAVPGSDNGHSDCIRKELRARGVTTSQLEVIPDCVANDWPEPLDNLGTCVVHRAKLTGGSAASN
jgi:hypothetical protein